jgi:SAM-dependent methyltransferase
MEDSYTLKRYESFYKYFKETHINILDFGCNTGRGGIVLKELNSNLVLFGVDIIEEHLDKIPNGVYEEIIDLSKSEFFKRFENIDIVVSGEVVEHIPFYKLVSYLKYFYDILPENGLLILTTPNPNSFLVKSGRKSVLLDPFHLNIMDKHFLKKVLQKIGFNNIVIKGSGKATRYFGDSFPIFNVYGSYLMVACK